jgi:hypothetical protein
MLKDLNDEEFLLSMAEEKLAGLKVCIGGGHAYCVE